ncbi:MAG TPA: VC0807 family protein [Rariglobus sp.]|jgi:hypothetical protein|nr:VC0807 family protein [Rariglobus sp.]
MTKPAPKPENLFLNLIFNIGIPWAALSLLSKPDRLGPVWALVVAVAFPLGYGAWDLAVRKKTNFISILGLVSVLASGGLGLMKVDPFWFAVKSGAMPVLIGLAVLVSSKTKRPLVREILYNDQVIDVPRIDAVLDERGNRAAFDRLINNASLLLMATFVISGALNFGLARYVIKSPGGTPEFNAELARMHLLDIPVATVPSMAMLMFALWKLINGIKMLTGLDLDDIFKVHPEKTKPAATPQDSGKA